MIRIRVPATSANLGTGFDCLGLALSLYNTFDVELSSEDILENVEERFNNPDNLFLKAYHTGCRAMGIEDHIHAVFHCEIPVSRGLGSSAAMITGGLYAASVLHADGLSKQEIFRIASEMEHHPDNAAPAVYGGMTACLDGNTMRPLPLSDTWHYTVFIPDFEVSTEQARTILPDSYPFREAVSQVSKSILTVHALETGDNTLLKASCHDILHEPYRKTLIHDFDILQKLVCEDTDGTLLISGSGSTCILISEKDLSQTISAQITERINPSWRILSLTLDTEGAKTIGENTCPETI